jgi:partitioning defective protein 3
MCFFVIISQNPDSWVVVHHLQTQSGILDPDDAVQDVADDREQIIASYDDHPGPDPTVLQGGGDGASGSSVGTGSPDIFRVHDGKYSNPSESSQNRSDVTEMDQPPNSLTLQVRRGSEPSLLTLDPNSQLYPSQNSQEPSKRWSAALVCRDDPPERLLTNGIYMQPNWTVPEQEEYQNENLPSFSRSGRLSMQFLGDGAK